MSNNHSLVGWSKTKVERPTALPLWNSNYLNRLLEVERNGKSLGSWLGICFKLVAQNESNFHPFFLLFISFPNIVFLSKNSCLMMKHLLRSLKKRQGYQDSKSKTKKEEWVLSFLGTSKRTSWLRPPVDQSMLFDTKWFGCAYQRQSFKLSSTPGFRKLLRPPIDRILQFVEGLSDCGRFSGFPV